MKFLIITALLLVCASGNAVALHPASEADRTTIQLLIDLANFQQTDINKNEKVLSALVVQLADRPEDQELK